MFEDPLLWKAGGVSTLTGLIDALNFNAGLSLFDHVRLVCIRKRDGLNITEANALRISVAIIALHGDPFPGRQRKDGPKGHAMMQVLHPMHKFLSMVTRLLFSGSL